MTSHWITDLEAALDGHPKGTVNVVSAARPPALDPASSRALLTPLMMAFMWSAASLREALVGQSFDPLAIGLRLLALALTVRTALALRVLVRRLLLRRRAERYGLALTEEGLLIRTPEGDTVVPREDVVAIRVPGQPGKPPDRYAAVYVVTQPESGRTHVALAPVLDRNPQVLAERLMRWLGAPPADAQDDVPPPSDLPSKLYDLAAKGQAPAGVMALRHGTAWLQRGPYTTVLLGLALLDGFARMDPSLRAAVGPIAPALLVFSLLVVPALWAVLVRIDIAPRKGLSLVLTPAEVIMRTRAGVHVVAFRNLSRATVSTRRTWSLLRGPHEHRALVLQPLSGDTVSYLESFLGEPAEVVAGLCEAYRQGRIRAPRGAEAATRLPDTLPPL